jgi:Tol biopolymer transport system component
MKYTIAIIILFLSSCAFANNYSGIYKTISSVPSQISYTNINNPNKTSDPIRNLTFTPSTTNRILPNCSFGPKDYYASVLFTPIDGHNLIAYSVRFPDDGLTLLNPDNEESISLHQFTDNKISGIDIGPKWSPDGKKIAFIFQESLYYLMIADLEKGNICPFSEGIKYYRDYNDSIAWSPDGTWIAWINYYRSPDAELQVLNIKDGKSSIISTEVAYYSEHIQWIDDTHIAFIQAKPNKPTHDLVIRSIEGKEVKTLLFNMDFIWDFAISPDGKWLAYTDENFYLLNNQSGVLRKYSGTKRGFPGYYSLLWSPDSKKILFPGNGENIQQYLYWIDKPDEEPQEIFHGYCSIDAWASDSLRFVSTLTPNQGRWNIIINNIFEKTSIDIPTLTRYPKDAVWNKN